MLGAKRAAIVLLEYLIAQVELIRVLAINLEKEEHQDDCSEEAADVGEGLV